ncbi:MAG: hypothetical protein FD147_2363 [Chloroflexi bacterium]|nr:MAG: hypothetical protein FD147_2363 [Chloroflexota bacterium]
MPNIDRLSVVTAMILLAYALTAFINFPTQLLNIQLPGFLFTVRINFITFISLVVTVLAAAGSDWLISDHPHYGDENRVQHWLLPAFTALVIGVPLDALRVSPSWWAVFGLGGLLLVGVFISEYIAVDQSDIRYAIARVSLSAVSLALLLVLLIAVRGAGLRLYLVLAAVIPAIGLVSAKTLHLRLGGWNIAWAIGIALVIVQITAGFFYLPLKPLQFGLVLLGITYGLISLAGNIEEKRAPQTMWIEPLIVFSIFSFIAIISK